MSSILAAELKAYAAANQSDTSSNGGRMSSTSISNAVNALFPSIDQTERAAGSTKYRKFFFKVDHDGVEALVSSRIYQDQNTTGDDKTHFFIGTQTDTQAAITGSERKKAFTALLMEVEDILPPLELV